MRWAGPWNQANKGRRRALEHLQLYSMWVDSSLPANRTAAAAEVIPSVLDYQSRGEGKAENRPMPEPEPKPNVEPEHESEPETRWTG
jgi:hypothetical protein